MARILVDLDGICADLISKWLGTYNMEYRDTLLPADITGWHVSAFVKPEAKKAIRRMIRRPGFFDDLELIPGAREGVVRLRTAGHTLRVATAKTGADSARAKIDWAVNQLGFEEHEVFVVDDKEWLQADCLIDDSPDNLRKYRHAWPDALLCSLIQPYNDLVDLQIKTRVRMFASWDLMAQHIEKYFRLLESYYQR